MDRREIPAGHSTRLTDWEPLIHAFAHLCEPVEASNFGTENPLHGLNVGIKDVINVAGMPTRNGSATCADAAPAPRDAPAVASLRAAGAHIIGKTTSTEFAFTDPTTCRNPHDLARSPGGSSSGSGAAVAAGILDLALGTQTAGSLCRPAAYCGVVGFKPTYGALPTEGVTPLAPSFDTVGIIARSVPLAAQAFRVMRPAEDRPDAKAASQCKAGRLLLDPDTPAAPAMLDALEQATSALAQVCGVCSTLAPGVVAAQVVADHGTVMHFEAAQAHGHILESAVGGLLKPKFRAGLEAGLATSAAEAQAARDRLAEARTTFWSGKEATDIVLSLPVPEGAPLLDGTTGFQHWLTCWTVFGGPLVSLPWGLDGLGRPRAILLAAHPQADLTLLAMAEALAEYAPGLPLPTLPQE